MSATELRQTFRRRFRAVVRQVWSLRVGHGVARTVVVAAVLVAAVAAVDYVHELPRAVRAGLAAVTTALVAVLAARWVVRPALAWDRRRVAAELEGLFPRLGQRLRTATEHGNRTPAELDRDGVAPGLVAALEEETAEKVKPLPLQAALPMRPVFTVGTAALACVAALTLAAAWAPEWRTALARVALESTPYTTLSVAASADVVDEGTDVEFRATMSGRTRPGVILHSREAGGTEWRQEVMVATDGGFVARLPKLRITTEYYVAAGPEQTPVREVVVRHALKIVGVRAEVLSPAYTGLSPATHDGGSFSAVQGSVATLRFEFDRPPAAATLVVKDATRPSAPPRRVDMPVQDRHVSAELSLIADVEYSVEARDADGMPVVPNRHRVRVTADQPPAVWFETPGEGLEVHTLAEVVVRARARDDFGIARVGIAFQINNEEERTLVLNDVDQAHQREARAEQLLMLEQFLLTQKDCVAYYAFAEDARPDGPQRTTTELRFIDIRPFLRVYQRREPGEGQGGPQRDLIFLDEVIARQRFNLNQTMRLEARSQTRLDLTEVEKTAAFENRLASQTHTLADFLAGLGVDGAAILAQAEEVMLSAVDSLQGAKFATAIGQERDALRYLMEARDTVQLSLTKQSRGIQAQARAFDRLQRQKIRRPNDQAETLAQIASELATLSDEEDEVSRAIAGPVTTPAAGSGNAANPMTEPTQGGTGPKAEPKSNKGGDDPARERQDDIAGRAAALDKVAAPTKGLTELAKSRIADAAKAANAAADSLAQGDRPAARKEVDRARELFRTAAKQVAVLAAEEATQQLAAARDLANDIALQVAPPGPATSPGGGAGGHGKMPGFGGAAEQAKTLKDVLEKLARAGGEGEAEAARKAAAVLKQEDVTAAIARLEKPGAGDDRGERQDLAERFGSLGQKIDQTYRETVAPRIEEIVRLEREANDLKQRSAAVDDPTDWRRLRQQGAGFIERLETAGLGDFAGEDLRAGLKSGSVSGGREMFTRGATVAHSRLVAKLQEFVSGERLTSGSEAVPPEYRDLVERYLRALSAGGTK